MTTATNNAGKNTVISMDSSEPKQDNSFREMLETRLDKNDAILSYLAQSIGPLLGDDFVPQRVLDRTSKSLLVFGELGHEPAVIKTFLGNDKYWAERFQREVSVYEAFNNLSSLTLAPQLLAFDRSNFVLAIEFIDGKPLATERYLSPSLSLSLASDAMQTVGSLSGIVPFEAPSRQQVRDQYGERFHRYASSGFLSKSDVLFMQSTVGLDHWIPAFNHGDPLLSNMIKRGDRIILIDWEFGDFFPPGFDLAVLATLFHSSPEAVELIRSAVHQLGGTNYDFWLLNCLAVASREVRTHSELPEGHPIKGRLPGLKTWLNSIQTEAHGRSK